MKVYELCRILEKIAPLERQEEWDNCGLLIGESGADIEKILVCLDVDPEAIEYAVKSGCNFIISHHPLIFNGIKKITGEDEVQKTVALAIQNRISVYAMHTNFDFADCAMNDHIAGLLNLENICGYFCGRKRGYPVGRTGDIRGGTEIRKLAALVGEKLGLDDVYYSGDDDALVNRLLISAGAFDADLLGPFFGGADVIISGDIKYHAAKNLKDKGILAIDAGHFGTEKIFPKLIKSMLEDLVNDIAIIAADFQKDVFKSIHVRDAVKKKHEND
jgi:GTP cyclohydrolase I